MITRRQFGRLGGLGLASLLTSGWMSCGKANDAIQNLRGILNQVEKALTALSLLSGLLPDAVNSAAKYLTAVCQFVDDVGRVLEDEATSAADKTRQILSWASGLVMPVIPPPIGPLLAAVAAAVDHFLGIFGTNVRGARSARVDNPPNLEFDQKQKAELHAIEKDAEKDKAAVEDWQKKAMITPHSSLTTPGRGEFLESKNNLKLSWSEADVSTSGPQSPAIVGNQNVITYGAPAGKH